MAQVILIALGANLPGAAGCPPIDTCRWAIQRLAALPGLRLEAASRWYRTAPVPASDQPDYINGVARLAGDADPYKLLTALHQIEAEAGRVRGAVDEARTLDLDLLAMDDRVISDAGLTLPHPRLQDRGFVLQPLCEVAPEWRHPVLGSSAAMLLHRLKASDAVVPLTQ